MDHFQYKNGTLHAEDVAINDIAATVGTPFYVYSSATLTRHYRLFTEALSPLPHMVCFAIKSLSNVAVLKTLGNLGAGMDVVSGGEYLRAKATGVPGDRIVFSGVGKTREEMRLALTGGIRQFNVESEPEMRALSEVATSLGMTAPIAVRVNPDVDAKTHEKIATGKKENKFGIPIARASEVYAEAARLPGLKIVGIDVHIGSQLTELEPFEQAYLKVADLTRRLRSEGHTITRLDLGGGLGIPYTRSNEAPPLPTDYGALIKRSARRAVRDALAGALVGVAQYVVGLGGFLEFVFRRFIAGIAVRVKFKRFLPVRLFYFVGTGAFCYAQHLVIVTFCHGTEVRSFYCSCRRGETATERPPVESEEPPPAAPRAVGPPAS